MPPWWGGPPGPRPTPWSACSFVRNPPFSPNHSGVALYRRRLPHDYETDRPVFLTWRLRDSLPSHRDFPTAALNSGEAFAAMDRLLDEACVGSFYLRQPAIADMIVDAIQYNAKILGHYVLHAFVVMPNHVHLLATPGVALPKLTKSLKGITGKRANAMLAMTGRSFWQEESYDHLVRHEREFEKIRNYIEENPVRAGLVREASEYRWSSAGWVTGGSPADQGSAPPSPSRRRMRG
jgi:REP element-mobilizing transposase RayT